jgi:hypothetical protein
MTDYEKISSLSLLTYHISLFGEGKQWKEGGGEDRVMGR